jgi:hypothetical protein
MPNSWFDSRGGSRRHGAALRVCDVPAAVEQGRCFRMACSNGTLFERTGVRGGAILRRRVTKPLPHRRFVDTPSSRRPRCMRYRGQQYSSRPGSRSSRAHRVQAILPAAVHGGGGARPGRGQGRRGRWKKPLEFPLLISYTLAKDRGKNRSNFLNSFRKLLQKIAES